MACRSIANFWPDSFLSAASLVERFSYTTSSAFLRCTSLRLTANAAQVKRPASRDMVNNDAMTTMLHSEYNPVAVSCHRIQLTSGGMKGAGNKRRARLPPRLWLQRRDPNPHSVRAQISPSEITVRVTAVGRERERCVT